MPYTQLYCAKEHFARIRDAPRLAAARRLARTVNTLRALMTASTTQHLQGALHTRQLLNALFYLGATLSEAFDVASDLKGLADIDTGQEVA